MAGLNFETWLTLRLTELDTDEEVFGPYILSIFDENHELEEQIEALDGILIELGLDDYESFRNEVLEQWQLSRLEAEAENKAEARAKEIADAEAKAKAEAEGITVENPTGAKTEVATCAAATSTMTDGEAKNAQAVGGNGKGLDNMRDVAGALPSNYDDIDQVLKRAILAKLEEESDYEEDDVDVTIGKKKEKKESKENVGLEKNMNLERVLNEQKEIKEKARLDSAKKKEKDKEDRIRQKQAAQDRNEKAKKKAAKGERKR